MSQLIMSASIRKNFVFDETTVKQLEVLAKSKQKSQTAIIQELIAESSKAIEKNKRIEAFNFLLGSLNNKLTEQSIQSIKESQDV